MTHPNPPAQASDEPMRAAPELTKEVVDSVQWMTGAPDVGDIPQPYAGAIVLLETFASIGMTARRDGQPTPNSLLCTKFANDLRLAATLRATVDVEQYQKGWQDGMQDAQGLLSEEIANAARYRWLLDNYARGDGYTDIDEALNNGEPEKHLSPAIDEQIAATKGAKT